MTARSFNLIRIARDPTCGVVIALAALALLPAAAEGREAQSGAAPTAKAKGTTYKGRTSQGERVAFKVRRGKVKRPTFLVVHRGCGVQFTFTGRSKIRRGRFSFGSRASSFFKGRLAGNDRVTGRAGIDFAGSTCPGGGLRTVHFRAHRKR